MLDQICIDYAGYVAPVQWHTIASYPLHCPDGRAKRNLYPPPYNGGYATPWCWIDGGNCGYIYGNWPGYVASRVTEPSDVAIYMTGTYDQSTRVGTIQAVLYNGGAGPLSGTCEIVITEDSLNYTGPNGDPWHNHVCRDYVPDYLGTAIDLPAGAYDTVVQEYAIDASWVERMCNVVVYAQDLTVHPDSGHGMFQGKAAPLLSFVGVAERGVPPAFYDNVWAQVSPNPCRRAAIFSIKAPAGSGYQLSVYGLDGSLVRELTGIAHTGTNSLVMNCARLPRGVYAYRLATGQAATTGKLILTD